MTGKASSSHRLSEGSMLPQLGFGSDCDFASLVQSNRFLFRVYTPKQGDTTTDDAFVAPKFDKQQNRSPCDLPHSSEQFIPTAPSLKDLASYQDAATHFDWTTRKQSPFILTSFSFAWAIWEALRRYRESVKHDVQIAVIDGLALQDRSLTALQLLKDASAEERHQDHWRWCRFGRESQGVLVYGCVPESTILTTIPLSFLVPHLPSYFLQFPEKFSIRSSKEPGLLDIVVWPKPGDGKPNFRQFCNTLSDKFLNLSDGVRLYDSTIGSVRLALALLQSWVEDAAMGDEVRFAQAVKKISELAWNISCWVDQQRVTLGLDLGDTIEGIVRRIAEEIRVRKKVELEDKVQIGRLQWAIDELNTLVGNYEEQMASHDCEDTFAPPLTPILEVDDDEECSNPPSPTGTVVSFPPSPPMTPEYYVRKHRLSISSDDETVVSRSASPFKPGKHLPLHLIFPPALTLEDEKVEDILPPSPTSLGGSPPQPTGSGSGLMPSALPVNGGLKRSLSTSSGSYFRPLAELVEESSKTDSDSSSSEVDTEEGAKPSVPSLSALSRHRDTLRSIRDYYCQSCQKQIGPFGYVINSNLGCVATGFLVGAFIAMCVTGGAPKRTLLIAT